VWLADTSFCLDPVVWFSNLLAGNFGLNSNQVGNLKTGSQFPLACPWARMEPLGSDTTSERTNKRQEQAFRVILKIEGFGCLEKMGKNVVV
jgi:hypothetical protein